MLWLSGLIVYVRTETHSNKTLVLKHVLQAFLDQLVSPAN
jgi:hypothetical protein